MKKKIFSFGFVFLLVFVFGSFFTSTVLAQDGAPIITYILNGVSANVTANPVINPIQIDFISDENIENWVSIKIEKNDSSVYKYFYPSENSCDGKATCSEIWDGHLSNGTIAGDGIYNVIVKIKSETVPIYDISFTSYTITVDTSVPQPTLSSIAITKPADKLNFNVGEELDITGLEVTGTYSDDSKKPETITSSNITGFINSTPVAGQVLTVTVNGKTVTYNVNINAISSVPTENIMIRNGNKIIYNGSMPLPEIGTKDILGQQVNAQSVLGILYTLDQKDDTFSVSDLSYNSGYQSFLLNCITPLNSEPACYNWNYVVNNVMPDKGIDKVVLTGSASIGFFFGESRKLISNSPVTTNDSLVITAQKYNYLDNTWVPLTGVTVGLLIPNADPSSYAPPVVVSDNDVDADGISSVKISNAGSYSIGIKNIDPLYGDYYFPTYPIIVTIPVSNNGGGGGSTIPPEKTFLVSKALDFLSQNPTAYPMYMDWVAIAAGAGDNSNLKSSITSYLKNNPFDSSVVTDNERHAMALMALGIDPYSGTSVNYIKKITDTFNGEYIGEEPLINDDIFALIVLANAGYSSSDEIIFKDIEYLLSPSIEPSDGDWGSIDISAALIQALKPFDDLDGVRDAISNAENYLIESQNGDGGFYNSSSTSWAIQALALNNSLNGETDKALQYLAGEQQDDGGLEGSDMNTRIWATSYAIPAVMNKSWGDILQSFEKPVVTSGDINSDTIILSVVEPILPVTTILIPNSDLDLIKKIEDKKTVEVPEIKNIRNSDLLKNSLSLTSINSESLSNNLTENNLGASVGNAVPIETSIKEISHIVVSSVISMLTYIGKGFVDLIIFLQSHILAVFK